MKLLKKLFEKEEWIEINVPEEFNKDKQMEIDKIERDIIINSGDEEE